MAPDEPSRDARLLDELMRLREDVRELRQAVARGAPADPDELLTTRQAAKYLKLSERALRMRAHRGQVKFEKMGRSLRFRRRDLIPG